MGKVFFNKKSEETAEELMSFLRKTFENNKEIFLHLLICNSSSSLDRRQSECLAVPPKPYITIIPNKTNNTLTIIDNGAGMTKLDLSKISAFNGFRAKILMQAIASGADLNVIWRYGFAFYFASLVADKVVVKTKHYYDEQYLLEYQAGGVSTLTRDASHHRLDCGSRMRLYLKKDQLEYLEAGRLKNLIRKYSSNISYGVNLILEETVVRELLIAVSDEEVNKMENEEKEKNKKEKTTKKMHKLTVTTVSVQKIV